MGKIYAGVFMSKEAVEACFIKEGNKYKGTEQLITTMAQSYCEAWENSNYEEIYKIFNALTISAKDMEEGTILYDVFDFEDCYSLAEAGCLSKTANESVATCFYNEREDEEGFQSFLVSDGSFIPTENETLKRFVVDLKNQYDKEDNE